MSENTNILNLSVKMTSIRREAEEVASYLSGVNKKIDSNHVERLVDQVAGHYRDEGKAATIRLIRVKMVSHQQPVSTVQAHEILARALGYQNKHVFAASAAKKMIAADEMSEKPTASLSIRKIMLTDADGHSHIMELDAAGAQKTTHTDVEFGMESETASGTIKFAHGKSIDISGDFWRFMEGMVGVAEFSQEIKGMSMEQLEEFMAEYAKTSNDNEAADLFYAATSKRGSSIAPKM